MNEPGRALARDLTFLGVASLLALVPCAAARTAAGFALAIFLPGYSLLRCLRTPARPGSLPDLLHCGAVSLALCPLALRLAGRVVPFTRGSVLLILVLLPAVLFAAGSRRPRQDPPVRWKSPGPAFYLLLALTLGLLLPTLLVSSTPDGGETRVKGWDLNNHLSIAETISARGLPPVNPFLQSDSPFYYHTFFHILLGAILVVAGPGVHPYFCIALLTVLLAAMFLGTLFRVAAELTGNGRAALLALPLVSLSGGFDLLPVLGLAGWRGETGSWREIFLRHWNVDGWVSNRGILVPSVFAEYYWVPHAMAALVVFLLALLFLRKSGAGPGAIGAAGACLASMAGYNGYIALGGAITLALLGGVDLARFSFSRSSSGRRVLFRSLLAGGTAVILGWPVLSLYLGERGEAGLFRWARPGPLLPLQLLLEFGPALLLGAAGMEMARRHRDLRRGTLPFLLMALASLPLICLVASTGENNDLAMRISLFSWIGLAILGGIALDRIFPATPALPSRGAGIRAAALLAIGLGFLSVAWFAGGAALAKPVLPSDEVAAGRWIRRHVPPGLLVQGSPMRPAPEMVYLGGHPAVLSDAWAGRLFYSSPADFSRRMEALRKAFSSPDPQVSCDGIRSLRIAALVVGPPEREDFPLLSFPRPWPCLTEAFSRGGYRVYVVR